MERYLGVFLIGAILAWAQKSLLHLSPFFSWIIMEFRPGFILHARTMRFPHISRAAGLALLCLVVLLTRLPFLGAGYGMHSDNWRVALAARHIAETGVYEVSRFPGYPAQEYVCALFWRTGPFGLNALDASFTMMAALFFALICMEYGVKDWWLAGLALAFGPVIYVNSVSSKDFPWALAFLLGSWWCALRKKPVLTGLLLGLAMGCRMTSGAAALPIALVLIDGTENRVAFRRVLIAGVVATVVAMGAFVPVYVRYGWGFFNFYAEHAFPAPVEIIERMTLGVWGTLGVAGLAIAFITAFVVRRRAKISGRHVLAWVSMVIIYGIAFVCLPDEAAYLIPAVPFVLLLAWWAGSRRGFQACCAWILISPFLSLAQSAPAGAPSFTGDLIWRDHEDRLAALDQVKGFLQFASHVPGKNAYIVGSWKPPIDVLSAESPETRYLYLVKQAELDELIAKGWHVWYLPGMLEFNYRVYGYDVRAHGARDVRELQAAAEPGSSAPAAIGFLRPIGRLMPPAGGTLRARACGASRLAPLGWRSRERPTPGTCRGVGSRVMFGVLASSDIREADFSRILLIKPSAVGDVVHTLPMLEKLRRRYPGARIDWLLTPENASIIRGHPAVSNIVLFARREFSKNGRKLGATATFLKMLLDIRAAKYELVIDLHGQARSAFIALASGACVRIGFGKPIEREASFFQGRRLGNIPTRGWAGAREGSWLAYTHRIPIPTLEVHAVERYLWLGKLLGFDNEPPVFNLPVSPEAEEHVTSLLAPVASRGQQIAVLVPGTMWETKHWRAEGFAGVARRLVESGFAPIIIGAPDEKELNHSIYSQAPGATDLTGKTTLADAVALIRRAAVVVTNDSGAMHIAAALGRPGVAIFGPTNPVQVGPYGQPESVVRLSLPCSPCNYRRLSQCPNDHACMRDLSVEMVMERINGVTSGTGSSNARVEVMPGAAEQKM